MNVAKTVPAVIGFGLGYFTGSYFGDIRKKDLHQVVGGAQHVYKKAKDDPARVIEILEKSVKEVMAESEKDASK